jgi:hypothetical protein
MLNFRISFMYTTTAQPRGGIKLPQYGAISQR